MYCCFMGCSRSTLDRSGELEKYRAGQLQAERLLEAREQSHRQQVQRLESQVKRCEVVGKKEQFILST